MLMNLVFAYQRQSKRLEKKITNAFGKLNTNVEILQLFAYQLFGDYCPLDDDHHDHCYSGNVGLLILAGFMVNGPYALITTAVSAELGVHPSLQGSSKALATVTAIIDGTGSIGAAVGPFLAGAIDKLDNVFFMLMGADLLALIVSLT